MINVLIIKNDIIQTQNLVNYLSQTIPEIRIYSIKSSGIDSLDVIYSKIPDLILLDLDLLDVSGIDIIKYIHINELYNYKKSIIIISENFDSNLKLKNNQYVYSFIQNPIELNLLKQSIINFINEKKYFNILTKKVANELNHLNFNSSHVGTQYLLECIQIVSTNNLTNFNLNKDVYPIVAQNHNTNINTIKCNIFNATINSYYESEEQFLSNYFRLFPLTKPSTKYIISTILDKI